MLDDFHFGVVGPTEALEKTVSIDSSATVLGFYLDGTDNQEKYFYVESIADIHDALLDVKLWIDYSYYNRTDHVRYGINRNAVQPLILETAQSFDFKDAPYYLFKHDSSKNRPFRITIDHIIGTTLVYSADNLLDLARYYGICYSTSERHTVKDFLPSTDPLYLLVAPEDIEVESKASVLVNDLYETQASLQSQSFNVTNAFTLDGDSVFLLDVDTLYGSTDAERKILKKWTMSTGVIEDVQVFDDSVSAFALEGTTLYIAAGRNIFKIDLITNMKSLVANSPDIVRSLTIVGDKFLTYAGGSHYLLDSDGTTLASNDSWDGGKTTIWIPAQKRVYFYRDGISPNDLCYLELDPDTDSFGDEGDSPYHGVYSFDYPLLRFGDSLSLVTGNGDIFSIDENTESKIAYENSLGFSIKDMIVLSDRILILVDSYSSSSFYVDGCQVITLSSASPYGEQSRTSLIPKEQGIALLTSPAGVTVVTRSVENINIGSEYYNPVRIRAVSEGALAGTEPLASRSVSREKARTWTLDEGSTQPIARGLSPVSLYAPRRPRAPIVYPEVNDSSGEL